MEPLWALVLLVCHKCTSKRCSLYMHSFACVIHNFEFILENTTREVCSFSFSFLQHIVRFRNANKLLILFQVLSSWLLWSIRKLLLSFKLWFLEFSSFVIGEGEKCATRSWWISYSACGTFFSRQSSRSLSNSSGLLYYHYANILALAAYTKISYSYYYLWMLKPYARPRTQTDKGKREKFL